jgi:succinate dehydrogenase / fumarate reductase cytochrome b subunit
MVTVDCARFGRWEFILRRLHSLTGLVPVGGFLVFHLVTNGSVLDGPSTFQARVDQLYDLGPSTLLLLEWPLIFLPIIFHAVIGVLIVCRGMRNLAAYPYLGNFRYTLQRWTGVVAFVFIFWHVFQMHGWFRFEWWTTTVARPLGGAQFIPADAAASAAQAIWGTWAMGAWYILGTLSCVYHLANGLWTMGITWGVWTSPRAQRWANVPAGLVGLLLVIVSLGSLYGFKRVERTPPHSRSAVLFPRSALEHTDGDAPRRGRSAPTENQDAGQGTRSVQRVRSHGDRGDEGKPPIPNP